MFTRSSLSPSLVTRDSQFCKTGVGEGTLYSVFLSAQVLQTQLRLRVRIEYKIRIWKTKP